MSSASPCSTRAFLSAQQITVLAPAAVLDGVLTGLQCVGSRPGFWHGVGLQWIVCATPSDVPCCRVVAKKVNSTTLLAALENGLSQWADVGPAGRFPQASSLSQLAHEPVATGCTYCLWECYSACENANGEGAKQLARCCSHPLITSNFQHNAGGGAAVYLQSQRPRALPASGGVAQQWDEPGCL